MDIKWTIDRVVSLSVSGQRLSAATWPGYEYLQPENSSIELILGAQLFTTEGTSAAQLPVCSSFFSAHRDYLQLFSCFSFNIFMYFEHQLYEPSTLAMGLKITRVKIGRITLNMHYLL